MNKPWYKSRTLWFNALIAAASTVAQSAGVDVASLSGVIIPAIAAVNAALRVLTNKGVGM